MVKEAETRVNFRPEDVISAQRMRFLRTSKFKILAVVWLVAVIWGVGQLLFPDFFPSTSFMGWTTIIGISLLYIVVVAAFYWIAPLMDYNNNPVWKTPFYFQFNEDSLTLRIEGKSKFVFIRWEQIRRVHENRLSYILYTSSEDNFLILPKSVFNGSPDHGRNGMAHQRFRQYLSTRSSLTSKDKERYSIV